MIKLKPLIESKLKQLIPNDPFIPNTDLELWRDDDDMNMNDEEWEEFQNELQYWLDDMRKRDLTDKIIDVDDLVTEWLLMDQTTKDVIEDLSPKEINKISKILQKKRERGDVCNMYKRIGIKYLGDRGKLKYVWEKDYYNKHFGIQN
mgnify:CR=1 FL=1